MYMMPGKIDPIKKALTPAEPKYQSEDGAISGNSAEEVNADLIRADWNNFKENDMPYILDYANDITSDKYVDNAVNQARTDVTKGYSLADAALQSRQKGLGVQLSSAQRNDQGKDMRRARGASLVDAENSARTAAEDRQNAAIAGASLPQVGA